MGLYATAYLDITFPKILPTPVEDKLDKLIHEKEDSITRCWSITEGKSSRQLTIKEEVRSNVITTTLKEKVEWLAKFADYGIGGSHILGFLYDERNGTSYHIVGIYDTEMQKYSGIDFKRLLKEDSKGY